mmetsp:Transcript_1051/g.2021  ORF Transcript_1051/g.2021 Transcript_1051/m.2021 type:complete len:217 (+) Transcript_1051:128-778(+)
MAYYVSNSSITVVGLLLAASVLSVYAKRTSSSTTTTKDPQQALVEGNPKINNNENMVSSSTASSTSKIWISVTGLRVKKSWWHPLAYPHFMMYAAPCFGEAQGTKGNLFTEARHINGIQHTLTVWQSRKDMQVFYRSPAHIKAMKNFYNVADYGKVYGYEKEYSGQGPFVTWEEALQQWEEHGQLYGKKQENSRTEKEPDAAVVSSPSSSNKVEVQ